MALKGSGQNPLNRDQVYVTGPRKMPRVRRSCPTEVRPSVSRMQTVRNFVGGEWLAPTPSNWHDLTNPATGESLGRVPMCGITEVSEAVRAAHALPLQVQIAPRRQLRRDRAHRHAREREDDRRSPRLAATRH